MTSKRKGRDQNAWEGEAPSEPRIRENCSSDEASPSPRSIPIRHKCRKLPAHGVHPELNKPTIVFLTVCTKDRRPWLASPEVHSRLIDIWNGATAWLVGCYILMPDHIHLFATPGEKDFPFDNWVKYWKSQFAKETSESSCKFQSGHWDTRLRSHESYAEKWDYVHHNPVRYGLVQDPNDWPFQGELNELTW